MLWWNASFKRRLRNFWTWLICEIRPATRIEAIACFRNTRNENAVINWCAKFSHLSKVIQGKNASAAAEVYFAESYIKDVVLRLINDVCCMSSCLWDSEAWKSMSCTDSNFRWYQLALLEKSLTGASKTPGQKEGLWKKASHTTPKWKG